MCFKFTVSMSNIMRLEFSFRHKILFFCSYWETWKEKLFSERGRIRFELLWGVLSWLESKLSDQDVLFFFNRPFPPASLDHNHGNKNGLLNWIHFLYLKVKAFQKAQDHKQSSIRSAGCLDCLCGDFLSIINQRCWLSSYLGSGCTN